MLQVYNFDANGYYIGVSEADQNPREPGKYLIPKNATTIIPPFADAGKIAKWDKPNTRWLIVDKPSNVVSGPDINLTPAQALQRERENMIVSPAQMRLVLLYEGLLDEVQAVADSDPGAKIVWEYANQIIRISPFIDSLKNSPLAAPIFGGNDPDIVIDMLFREAMALNI